jgi:hypothetical protein
MKVKVAFLKRGVFKNAKLFLKYKFNDVNIRANKDFENTVTKLFIFDQDGYELFQLDKEYSWRMKAHVF